MKAHIFRPTRNAMQSGRSNTRKWVLEFEPRSAQSRDPLMGWTSSDDTAQQIRLRFESQEQAETYAKRRGISYEIEAPQERRIRLKSYADNFRWQRPG